MEEEQQLGVMVSSRGRGLRNASSSRGMEFDWSVRLSCVLGSPLFQVIFGWKKSVRVCGIYCSLLSMIFTSNFSCIMYCVYVEGEFRRVHSLSFMIFFFFFFFFNFAFNSSVACEEDGRVFGLLRCPS